VDESPGGETARVSFAWSPDQNFIISTRTVETKDGTLDRGTQWIGWDPIKKEIRSWNFEADGGFGEGAWTKDGDNWIVKTTSVIGRLPISQIFVPEGLNEVGRGSRETGTLHRRLW
jgi:hypothetical protein